MQEYLEMALAEPDLAAYNQDILPIDDISDHPPLAGCIVNKGTTINFISWNIMQGYGGKEHHGRINNRIKEKMYRSLNYYMNKLLDIGSLDLILLQEAKKTPAWKYINEDRLETTPTGVNRNWKCIYDGSQMDTRNGLAIYYNNHRLIKKGYTIYPGDFATSTGSTTSSNAHPVVLGLRKNIKMLTILNVHLNPPKNITTQTIIYDAIERFVNKNNTLAIIGDSNIKYNPLKFNSYSNLINIPFTGYNMTVSDFLFMNKMDSIEINTSEDNNITKAVLIYHTNNSINQNIIKYPITDKYNYYPDSTLDGMTDMLSAVNKSKYQREASTPFNRRDQYNLTRQLNSPRYMSKKIQRNTRKDKLKLRGQHMISLPPLDVMDRLESMADRKKSSYVASGVKTRKSKKSRKKTRRKY